MTKTGTQKPRIRFGKHRDGYWYVWRNGKRQAGTAYGDKIAAKRAADEPRGHAS